MNCFLTFLILCIILEVVAAFLVDVQLRNDRKLSTTMATTQQRQRQWFHEQG